MLHKRKDISVIVIEDHAIFTEGLCHILENVEGVQVAGTFLDGDTALDFIREMPVDVIFLDISLPGTSGMEVCRLVKALYPETKIIALSNHAEKSVISEMLDNGANGYLLKNTARKDLVNALIQVMEGQFILNEEVRNILFAPGPVTAGVPRLTKRELEILKMVSKGTTTAAIATQLFITVQTVESHRRNIMQKFKVNNAAAMVRMALEKNIIS